MTPDQIDCGHDRVRAAMGIPWMTEAEILQAIPPAYTRFIGEQFLAQVSA